MTHRPFALLLFLSASAPAVAVDAPPPTDAYVEFLWDQQPAGAVARRPTLGFLLDGRQQHRVCVAALPARSPARGLVIEAVDAAGAVAMRHADPSYVGEKTCYAALVPGRGVPGRWTYKVYFDGAATPVAMAPIEVAATLPEAPFYRPSGVPYVLGRPNYDAALFPSDQFRGRLVWLISVDKAGTVTGVQLEAAEGVGEQMKDRAIAAGWLSLFPPDPARAEGFTYRRELNFAPE